MGTLELQVREDVVFAHFRAANGGPNNGGYLGRVFPGGHFKGIGFAELQALGTGRHAVAVDERAQSERGREPTYESEWHQRLAGFYWSLFMYRVGACTAMEVLGSARDVFHAESPEHRWSDSRTVVDGGAWSASAIGELIGAPPVLSYSPQRWSEQPWTRTRRR